MAPPPLVSVVMPVYNGEAFLRPAIESILGQTFADIECVVVNDGSTDGSRDLLERFARADPRVRVDDREHGGLIAALNRGIEIARGKYVARMDADDVALPDRLARQVAWLEAHPSAAAIGGAVVSIDAAGRRGFEQRYPTEHREIRDALRHSNCFAHSAVTLRAGALRAAGGYRPAFADAEDYDLWLRLCERHEMGNLAEPVLHYRFHSGQVGALKLEQQVLSVLGARAAAKLRREAGRDPASGAGRITRAMLLEWGVSAREIDEAAVTARLDRAELLSRAGAPEAAMALLDEAAARGAEGRIDRWLAARVAAAYAKAHRRQGRPLRALLAACRAFLREPFWAARAAFRRQPFWAARAAWRHLRAGAAAASPLEAAPVPILMIAFLPDWDRGGQVNLLRLVRGLDRRRFAMTVVVPAEGDLARDLRAAGAATAFLRVEAPPLREPGRWPRAFLSYARLRGILRRTRPRIVYVDVPAHVAAVRLAGLGLGLGARIVSHAQQAAGSGYDRLNVHLADVVVTVSEAAAARFARFGGRAARRRIMNAVDADRFAPGEARDLRLALEAQDGEPVLLYVGELSVAKGLADLVDAFAGVRARRADAWLWIAGRGAPEAEASLRRRAEATGAGARIRWLGRRPDVDRLLRAADIFVFPSLSEGMSLALLEAMAAGLPIAASAIPGNAELIEGGAGVEFPPAAPAELARALLGLLDDPEGARRLGAAARARVLERHRVEQYVAAFEEVFSALARPAAPRPEPLTSRARGGARSASR